MPNGFVGWNAPGVVWIPFVSPATTMFPVGRIRRPLGRTALCTCPRKVANSSVLPVASMRPIDAWLYVGSGVPSNAPGVIG